MTEAVIYARGVIRAYGSTRALDGLSIDVPRGRVFGLVGPNGSGKSTFLALIAGAEAPEAGELLVFGQRPARALRARLGVVFQENTADPAMTPIETLVLAGRLHGMARSEARKRGEALLDAIGLADRARHQNATLSGGMRRRVELARALLAAPDLLLLDEPTTGVDPGERRAFWEAARDDAGRRTTILATNDLSEADAVCDGVAFLAAGRVAAAGTPAELKRGLRAESLRLVMTAVDSNVLATIRSVAGPAEVAWHENEVRIMTDDAAGLVPALFAAMPGKIRSVGIEKASLEDAYFARLGDAARRGTVGAPS